MLRPSPPGVGGGGRRPLPTHDAAVYGVVHCYIASSIVTLRLGARRLELAEVAPYTL